MLAKVWLAGLCSTCRPGTVWEEEGSHCRMEKSEIAR